MSTGWVIQRNGACLTLGRAGRFGMDVMATRTLDAGPVGRGRLAHQIRQDLWRNLRHITGFSPVVKVMRNGPTLTITAGGEVSRKPFPKQQIETQIADLLGDPAHIRRWLTHARVREVSHA